MIYRDSKQIKRILSGSQNISQVYLGNQIVFSRKPIPTPPPKIAKYLVGGSGALTNDTMAYSMDGFSWKGLGKSIFTTQCSSICWNGSVFVAGGYGTNALAYSYDGLTWVGLGDSTYTGVGAICWNGSFFLAGASVSGQGLTFIKSSDGINWSNLEVYDIFTSNIKATCWNGSRFVAVGSGTNSIAYSDDGENWVGCGATNFIYGYGVCWGDSKFIAFGSQLYNGAYSSDGINWTSITVSANGSRCGCWNGSKFIAGGVGGINTSYAIFTSNTGTAWGGSLDANSVDIHSTIWDGSKFLAGGDLFYYADNDLGWTQISFNLFSSIQTICSKNAPLLIPAVS